MKGHAILLALLVATAGCKSSEPAPDSPPPVETETTETTAPEPEVDPMQAALQHEGRPEAERARDQYRHPAETLAFFGVDPGDEVLELWAGGGWYTHVLAPYLAEGKLHVTAFPADHEREYFRKARAGLDEYLTKYGWAVNVIDIDPENLDFGENQVDVVLTFRNLHNWVKAGYDAKVYAAAYKALKPGGTFGVVEHRGPEGMTREQAAETGYMSQSMVIEDIEKAGFQFVEASEVNANPKDTADHPEGVWTLPPSLRLGDVDRAKYEAIGESDRMTLKFVKPTE